MIERYEIIRRIEHVIKTKQKQDLNITVDKRKDYTVSLHSAENNKTNIYRFSIILSDFITILTIDNIDELLLSLKKGMIFPGDEFIGLKAIEMLDKRGREHYWRAACLLCGRITEISNENIKHQKSCGCLNSRAFDSNEDRFHSKIDKQENVPKELQIRGTLGLDEESCWLWTGYKNKDGYGRIRINKLYNMAHRYSYELFHNRKTQPGILICHRCDNPSCVNPNHLFEGTQLDNMRDMFRKKRDNRPFGERHHKSKLTEKEVLEIRDIKGKTQTQIAKEYKVSISTINNIFNKKVWRHI